MTGGWGIRIHFEDPAEGRKPGFRNTKKRPGIHGSFSGSRKLMSDDDSFSAGRRPGGWTASVGAEGNSWDEIRLPVGEEAWDLDIPATRIPRIEFRSAKIS